MTPVTSASSALADFTLPAALEAHDPPEARGLARDGVRLMVSRTSSGEVSHHRFRALPRLLLPGDLLVVNTTETLPAQVRVWWADPGDLRTDMHQLAFPGEDISDRPEPASVVPAFVRLVTERLPSGRYRASHLLPVTS